MCKVGDIIVINEYIGENGAKVGKHSFIVIDDNGGTIKGLDYSLVTSVISSFKSEEQKLHKLKYKGNIEVEEYKNNYDKTKTFKKSSYVKADKLFYFNKSRLNYYVFGRISDDLLDELIRIIIELSNDNLLTEVTENL